MEITLWSLIIALIFTLLLLFKLLLPHIRKFRGKIPDDSSDVSLKPHSFKFKENPNNPLNEKIVAAINLMGGVGDNAEAEYQTGLETLRAVAEEAVPIIVAEYNDLPEIQYLDRWSLIQLLAELKHPMSLPDLDEILSSSIPPERSKAPHTFSTRREEIIIRTTAVEAITQIAAEKNREAIDLLLKHTQHENFSVKRAAIQSYLTVGEKNARKVLLEKLPKSDHYILDIRREDVRKIPQPQVEKIPRQPEIDDLPRIQRPKPPRNSDKNNLT